MEAVPWNPNAVFAEYHEQPYDEFRGNPLIEALPPVLSRREAALRMARFPGYDDAYRRLPREQREEWLPVLDKIRQPLSVHVDHYGRLRRLIIGGYLDRNPALPNYYSLVHQREERAFGEERGSGEISEIRARASWGNPEARGLTLLGGSGMGKTVMNQMCLGQFNQVIQHREYRGRSMAIAQLVYVHLEAPKNGSIVTTCVNFFQALDDLLGTTYERDMTRGSATVEKLMPRMARVAALHCLGVLVIDEVQELRDGAGERAFLSFVGRLMNQIGVPVVLVGGVDALPILRRQFRLARRGHTEGDILLDRSRAGAEWRRFVERLWRYQVTRTETPLDADLLSKLLDASQGVTDSAVKLYKQVQLRAMAFGGDERITPDLIQSVAEDSQMVAQSVFRALRAKDKFLLERMGDVVPPDGVRTVPFARGDGTDETEAELDAGSAGAEARSAPDSVEEEAPADCTPHAPEVASARGAGRGKVHDAPGSILVLLKDGKDRGEDAYTSLVAAGLIDGEAWRGFVPLVA